VSNRAQHLSEEGNAVAKDMLQTLSVLQQRAKEKDPVGYKKRERFVMGLKQVSESDRCGVILLTPCGYVDRLRTL
jgi:hypothetical protein